MKNFSKDVLGFWFEELAPEQHFISSSQLDATIQDRFLPLYEALVAQPPNTAQARADELLAAVIVLDQFPRNMFRRTAKAFASDPMALTLAHAAIRRHLDTQLPEAQRGFIYMPLMHSELLSDQELCIAKFDTLGGNPHAVEHRDVIAEFGRFPHRNAVLGRHSTAAELAYLETAAQHGQ